MPVELFPHIFRKLIPLPKNPLRAVNSYVIKGDGRHLVIDTGMNRPECREAMTAYLAALGVDLARTDFFITHFHADHLGLVSDFVRKSSKVYLGSQDNKSFLDADYWTKKTEFSLVNGFPEPDIEFAISHNPGKKYQSQVNFEATIAREGDVIEIGEYSFQCIETPGHCRGHLCLYEPNKKILFSGDHILGSITPNLAPVDETDDPLGAYLASLDKIYPYHVEHVLPGHREPFSDCKRRILELKKHHELRNEEVLSILKNGKLTAYEVASRMKWDIRCKNWEEFPVPQKLFASAEALAHLQYLERALRLRSGTAGKVKYFGLASSGQFGISV
jgi:glyoxylase-like metal-dependent hydrolase (beta-lactamase superfamily II)